MKRRGKRAHRARTVILQIVFAVPCLSVAFAVILAKMILGGVIGEEHIFAGTCVIGGLVAFLLSLYCAIRMPQKKALWGLAAAGWYALSLPLGNLLLFGVSFGRSMPILLSVLGGGLLGSLLGGGRRRKIV